MGQNTLTNGIVEKGILEAMLEGDQELIRILQASLAPVTVISGAGLLLSSMTLRYGRTTDRIRLLLKDLVILTEGDLRRKLVVEEIRMLFGRARLIRTEIILVASGILCVAMTIFFLFASFVYKLSLGRAAQFCFIASILFLLLSMAFFIGDILVSLRALKFSINSHVPLTEIKKYRKTDLEKSR
jgi:hypothetical protein